MVSPTTEQKKYMETLLALQHRPIKRIVLSGGGAKGIAYPGAYRALFKSGLLSEVTDISGSSAGAITAALIAVGAPVDYIRETFLTKNMASLLGTRIKEKSNGVMPKLTRDGKELYNFINEQIAYALSTIDLYDLENKLRTLDNEIKYKGKQLLATLKGTKKEITFAQLSILHQVYPKRFKNLTVTAVEYPLSRLQQFNYKKTPDVPIALACRASASIPIVLKPVEINIKGKKATFVDGGLKNNIPADLVSDREHYEETLVFAFGEGSKADIHFCTDRVEYAIHRSHWSEAIELNFLQQLYKDVIESTSSPRSREKLCDTLTGILKQRENVPYSDPQYLSPQSAKKLQKYLLAAIYKTEHLNSLSAEKLASNCWAFIKKIKRPLYKPHKVEYAAQNILPRYLGFNMPVQNNNMRYEELRRLRDHFPLRTVDLHVGPITNRDFKKATSLARVMYAFGYADTLGYILNHDLTKNTELEDYYDQINHSFIIIYRALLAGMSKQPDKDAFLKHWNSSITAGNNQFEAIKSYSIKSPTSLVSFAFTRAIEFHDQLIDKEALFKETYLEAFKRKFFAKSKSLGPTFFSSHSLENAVHKNPNLIPSLDSIAAKPRNGTRLNSIAHELQALTEELHGGLRMAIN
jgi:NTE family protein